MRSQSVGRVFLWSLPLTGADATVMPDGLPGLDWLPQHYAPLEWRRIESSGLVNNGNEVQFLHHHLSAGREHIPEKFFHQSCGLAFGIKNERP